MMNSKQILEREYLEIRAKILQLAASLDRMNRADGSVEGDDRVDLVQKGIAILASEATNRAEQVQLLFSREFDESWQDKFQISART